MKVLVLGASGMAGHTICLYFKERGHDVTGFSRKKIDFIPTVIGDAKDTDNIKELVLNGRFDVVINCIGVLNQFAEQDKASAVFLNAYFPHFLASVTNDIDTRIIHMSTDCVFSGKAGCYKENSLRDGEIFYDRSKALGELEDAKNLTFRNSIIGPDISSDGIGLLNWFMKQRGTINGYTKAIWTGVTTLTLAKAMEKAVEEKLTGLYHLVNNTTISKFDLLNLFNKYLRNNQIEIVPSDALISDKSLINTRSDFSFVVPDYEEMVVEMKNWIIKYKKLYPHYEL